MKQLSNFSKIQQKTQGVDHCNQALTIVSANPIMPVAALCYLMATVACGKSYSGCTSSGPKAACKECFTAITRVMKEGQFQEGAHYGAEVVRMEEFYERENLNLQRLVGVGIPKVITFTREIGQEYEGKPKARPVRPFQTKSISQDNALKAVCGCEMQNTSYIEL